ncbi:M20 family metallopeptidase [Kibdelosporangium persicum]|uniref:Succinyl-diaminopimelate desuccinylase n=1 Tax=Kibdelosporangium persicum TaxID=2698649 RepID=A0ABX2FCA3_9PSEU|nr:M20/M25/M40 family metallo-hydrolase [Kibdelosporangium persicum]NRN69004.1 Succinyl-diaminopimelate desuccinylase [Kibdelosporangium persicum]
MDLLAPATRLLSIPSTADRPAELHRALEFVLDFVGPGFTVERFESHGKPSALLYAGSRRRRFAVILNAHLDVVPGRADQFVPRLEGDRLYARGAHDMKVAALVEALVFRELGPRLPIALQLVTDEEVGGRDGTRHQLDQGVTGDFVIIGEQSGLKLVTDSKGILGANLRATGRTGHSAYPWNGDNALLKLLATIENLLAEYPVPDSEAWRTTVNVARIETANTARNQVPAQAEAWLDIRFPPEDTTLNGRTEAEITEYLQTFCLPGVTAEVDYADPPHKADRDRPETRSLRQAARNQGFDGDFLIKHGAADSRFFYQRGIDAVIFGIGGDGLHGPNEYADITTIEPYYQALTEFLVTLPQ